MRSESCFCGLLCFLSDRLGDCDALFLSCFSGLLFFDFSRAGVLLVFFSGSRVLSTRGSVERFSRLSVRITRSRGRTLDSLLRMYDSLRALVSLLLTFLRREVALFDTGSRLTSLDLCLVAF